MRARTFTALFGWHSLFKIFFFFLIHFACPGFRVRSVGVVYSYCCCVRVDSSRLANIHTHTLSLSHPPPPPPSPRLERNPAFTYQDCTTVYSLVLSLLWCEGVQRLRCFLSGQRIQSGVTSEKDTNLWERSSYRAYRTEKQKEFNT